MATNRISPAQAVLIGGLSYAVLAFARKSLIAHMSFETEWARTADVTVLYLVILFPGFLVGRLRQTRFIVLGFAAGFAGEFLRNVMHMTSSVVNVPHEMPVEFPGAAVWLSVLLHCIPNGVLAGAGGALGWAWGRDKSG